MIAGHRLSPGKYRLTVADYERLAQAGAFVGFRTELIEGNVIVTSPQFRPHGMIKMELYDALRYKLRQLGSPLRPVIGVSLALSPESMPDPDIMLTSEPRGARAVPLGSVALVIEVADSSLSDDLGPKLVLYVQSGVPEYWVADMNGRLIRQFWRPSNGLYEAGPEKGFGQDVTALTMPELTIGTGTL